MPRKARAQKSGESDAENTSASPINDAPPAEAGGTAPAGPDRKGEPAPFSPFLAPPRDLITAYLLLLLKNWSMHGYQLMQQLMVFGYQPADPGGIYRLLRQLESQGFVVSSWETGEAGPARRRYSLTEAGEAFLKTWATAIANYQKTLKFWSDLYGGIVTPPGRE